MIDAPERLNIKDFMFEETKKDLSAPFNPEREFTASDWQKSKKKLRHEFLNLNQSANVEIDFDFLHSLAVLDPRTVNQFITHDSWENLKDDLGKYRIWDRPKKALAIKIAAPERASRESLLSEWEWENIKRKLDKTADAKESLKIIGTVKLLEPEKVGEFSLNEHQWLFISSMCMAYKAGGYWTELIETLPLIKLADPSELEKLGLTHEDWHNIWSEGRHTMKTLREEDPEDIGSLAKTAANLKILAAKEIKIGDKIEFIMPQQFLDTTAEAQLPQMRKF
jgi:hypothetical protein